MTKGDLKAAVLKLRNGTATAQEKEALLQFLCEYVIKTFIRSGIADSEEL